MVSFRLSLACLAALFVISGCSNNDNDRPEGEPVPAQKTYVIFSPATSDMPVPNDILFGQEVAADGTLSAGTDTNNPVITGIDYMDGNSVLAPIDIRFSESLDNSQIIDATSFIAIQGQTIPNPNQNVFLLPLSYPGGDALRQATVGDIAVEIPMFSDAAIFQTAAVSGDVATLSKLAVPSVRAELLSLDGGTDNVIRINPLKPLRPETKYLLVITGLDDADGNPVYPANAYNFIKDPANNLGDLGLEPIRAAIQGWEQLANGYFSFISNVYDAAGLPIEAPTGDAIVLSMTLTTGGTDTVLKSTAAPEYFFEKTLRTSYKQDAISKLVSGTYNLNSDNSNQSSITDAAINSTIGFLLSSATLPDSSVNPLYSPDIAAAIAGGANYTTIAADASAAHIMQRAAAEAGITVHDSADETSGDKAPYVSIATEAVGTVAALAQGAQQPVNAIFPVPGPRDTRFYRRDAAGDINPALAAPALVYQGQITLPLYQAKPSEADGYNVVSSTWQADTTIGAMLDMGNGNEMGTTPPSSMVTYRYPFPQEQSKITVPLLATLPEPTTLANFGMSKPADGWPVVIFVHGITADRSTALPMADALAFACVKPDLSGVSGAPCFATVAIDHPLHGIAAAGSRVPGLSSVSDPSTPPQSNNGLTTPAADLIERHYNFTADATANPIPMDYTSEFGRSGSLFINLKHFANSRDSMRQMVMDLLNLNASLATMDVDGDGEANDLDTNRVYLVGHSLGAINGLTFLAINNSPQIQASPFSSLPIVKSASAIFPGAEITRLLINSQSLGPVILPSLAAASEDLSPGTTGLETYLSVFQGVFDSADAMNFVADLAAYNNTGIVISEVIGDGVSSPSDKVIPNGADTRWGEQNTPLSTVLESGFTIANYPAPLAGSEALIAQAGAIKSADVGAASEPVIMITRYTEGSHLTPVVAGNTDIDPLTSGAVFNEILQQTVTLFALEGVPQSGSIIVNSDVIEP